MEKRRNLVSKAIRAVFWSYASKYCSNFLIFISTLILARLLVQEDFGIAGYALVVVSFLEVLRGLGIGSALIFYPEDANRTNTGFWLTLGVGIFLFMMTWVIAPFVGRFFHDDRAVSVVRAMGSIFPIEALCAVHDALLRKHLAFNLRFIPDVCRGVAKGMVSILLAIYGFGAWSLIVGQITGALAGVVAYWVVWPWHPVIHFSPRFVKPLLSYGSKITIVNCLAVLLNNLDYLLIGRYFNAAALGIYTFAFRIPEMTIKQLYVMVSNVVFPAFTKVRHDMSLLRSGYFRTLRYVTILTFPLGIGLALVAKPFVLVFLTEKWVEAAAVIQPIALYTVLRSIEFSTGALYKAKNLTGLLVKIKMFQALITLPALGYAAAYLNSIVAIGWTQVGLSFLAAVSHIIAVHFALKISISATMRAILPAVYGVAAMIPFVLLILAVTASATPLWQLISSCTVGAVTFCITLWLFQRDIVVIAGVTLRAALIRR